MNKYRLGVPDLLLIIAFYPALTGHFWVAMALLAVYAVVYGLAAAHQRETHR